MRYRPILRSLLLTGAVVSGVHSQAAWAADAEQSAAPPEIVVTAQRRTESVQKVSIAVTALSGDQLQDKAVAVQRDLQNVAPGITITKTGLTESINIRGIGLSSGSPQVANGVATYVDGLFQPPVAQSFGFYDIKSVEVLRGPQGTLVGSNSTGGAVFINSARPELGKLGGMVNLLYGSYDHLRGDGAINLPIGENLAIRFATNQEKRDSYYTDLGPNKNRPDRLSEQDERLGILYKSGGFSAYLKAEFNAKETGGYAYQPIVGTQFTAGRTNQRYVLDYDSPTSNKERAFTTLLDLKYETDGGLILRSLTGYQNKRIWNTYDLDGSSLLSFYAPPPVPGVSQFQDQYVREREYTQEFNVISDDSKPFNFILGGYYQKNKIDVLINVLGTAPFPIVVNPRNSKLTLGGFAQGNYRLSEKFEVQAGLRYSHFDVDGDGAVYFGGPPPLNFATIPQTGSHKDGEVTGKLSLNFKPDDTNLIYAFAARGYKPGGINPPGGEFTPETVWDFEAGWKSSFLDRKVRTQIGVFYNKYNGFQQDVINPLSGQSGVVNLAKGTIKGFEGQIQAKLGSFSFDGGVSYVDSSFSRITVVNRHLPFATANLPPCAAGQAPPACFNYQAALVTTNGGPNLLSPKWTWNVGADYTVDLGDITVTPRVSFNYIGEQWTYVTYIPQLDLLGSRHLLNASVTVRKDNIKLEGFVTNLTKEYYVSGQMGNNEFYGAPREFGLRLGVTF